MSKFFICYSRRSEAVIGPLADDIEALGHEAWFDRKLSGGQSWWDTILSRIRDCDILVMAMSPESLDSVACRHEYAYAGNIGKRILPILVADEVSLNLLPPVLSAIEFVDYRSPGRTAALLLARAVGSLPPSGPLPDPLPPPPELPVSYLGGLRERIEATDLSFAEQSALLIELKTSLKDADAADDGRTLLRSLRGHRDLRVAVAEEIDLLLNGSGDVSPRSTSEPEAPRPSTEQTAPARTLPNTPAHSFTRSRLNELSLRLCVVLAGVGGLFLAINRDGNQDQHDILGFLFFEAEVLTVAIVVWWWPLIRRRLDSPGRTPGNRLALILCIGLAVLGCVPLALNVDGSSDETDLVAFIVGELVLQAAAAALWWLPTRARRARPPGPATD